MVVVRCARWDFFVSVCFIRKASFYKDSNHTHTYTHTYNLFFARGCFWTQHSSTRPRACGARGVWWDHMRRLRLWAYRASNYSTCILVPPRHPQIPLLTSLFLPCWIHYSLCDRYRSSVINKMFRERRE